MKQGTLCKFLKRKLDVEDEVGGGSSSKRIDSNEIPLPQRSQPKSTTTTPINMDLNDLPLDPGDRPKVTSYHPNQRDEIRRAYLIKKACQPKGHNFPTTLVGKKKRRFVEEWFDEFDWLEYSIKKNKAYCLYCYLFGDSEGQKGGRGAFVTEGFCSWSKKYALYKHLGDVDSYHNKSREKCENLMRKNQSISQALHKQTEIEMSNREL